MSGFGGLLALWIFGCTSSSKDPCEFELEQWCHNSESAGGPDPETADCDPPTIESLMSEPYRWHGRCETADGTLEFVEEVGSDTTSTWYFDGSTFSAFTHSTDVQTYCGERFEVAYGFHPRCDSECVLEGLEEASDSGWPYELPAPCE
jgi:hypothetical protein